MQTPDQRSQFAREPWSSQPNFRELQPARQIQSYRQRQPEEQAPDRLLQSPGEPVPRLCDIREDEERRRMRTDFSDRTSFGAIGMK